MGEMNGIELIVFHVSPGANGFSAREASLPSAEQDGLLLTLLSQPAHERISERINWNINEFNEFNFIWIHWIGEQMSLLVKWFH